MQYKKTISVSTLFSIIILVTLFFISFKSTTALKSQNNTLEKTIGKYYQLDSLSSTEIYGPRDSSAVLYLYAPDEKKIISPRKYLSCPYPNPGGRIYNGNYQLIVDTSFEASPKSTVFKNTRLNIGKHEFVEGTARDGELESFRMDPTEGISNVILYSHGTCNYQLAHFYGYDFKQNKLVQYKFRAEDGTVKNSIEVGFNPEDIEIDALEKTGLLETKYYDNVLGDTVMNKWRFNPSDNIFYRISR